MDLASRGIDVIVAETRSAGEPPSVKCNHVSARSMEIFRRLGVAPKLRDAGLPADFPNDCSFRTTATGIELSRIQIPCRARRYTATGGPDTWWPTPEPPHRINQIYLEPVLFAHAAATPGITILNRTEFEEFSAGRGRRRRDRARPRQRRDAAQIDAAISSAATAPLAVRKAIGAKLSGTPVVQRVQSTYIRAPNCSAVAASRPGCFFRSIRAAAAPRSRSTATRAG